MFFFRPHASIPIQIAIDLLKLRSAMVVISTPILLLHCSLYVVLVVELLWLLFLGRGPTSKLKTSQRRVSLPEMPMFPWTNLRAFKCFFFSLGRPQNPPQKRGGVHRNVPRFRGFIPGKRKTKKSRFSLGGDQREKNCFFCWRLGEWIVRKFEARGTW